jgi:hypothetical protein
MNPQLLDETPTKTKYELALQDEARDGRGVPLLDRYLAPRPRLPRLAAPMARNDESPSYQTTLLSLEGSR